jgi:hypothetical protein
VIHEDKSHVCRLKKAMYGPKQTPRAWYEKKMNEASTDSGKIDRHLY